MQEENTKQDELIDVGEENEKSVEINLDEQQPKEEAAKEEKVEVEQVESKEEKPVEEKKDELKEYSEGVQKRIAKLTRKMREAERQREEAIAFAEATKKDKDLLEGRLSKLDKTYVSEFESRVKTNLAAAKLALKNAIESQNVEAQVAAQEQIANLTMDAARLSSMKNREEPKKEKEVNITPQRSNTQQAVTDPRAEEWAAKNSWFGNDSAMTYTAFDIHKKLVEEEGFDPKTDEYYTEVDKRIRLEFPHKFDKIEETTTERAKPAQNVASAKRSASTGRRKTVKLTPSQVAIAKRLGVPLEDYAKQLKITEGV
jgi:type II secretory pathway pseudopilin PulG